MRCAPAAVEKVDGHLAAECPAPGVAYSCGVGASVAHAIRKQPCYWASLFTAANATEQDRYLMAPALGRDGGLL